MGEMMKLRIFLLTVLSILWVTTVYAADKSIQLPPPQTDGGKPLMQVLKARHSDREFAAKPLPLQTLSNLLWAANGINRPETDKRTAPSAHNWQDIDVYVVKAEGAYRYDAKSHSLLFVAEGDHRAATGQQDFVKEAAVNLVYVSDLTKMTDVPADYRNQLAACDAGLVAENAYLYCASEGLAAVVRASIDSKELAPILKLSKDQAIVLAHSIGFPKE